MLTQDRQSKILSILNEQGSVTVSRLTEILSASESTIRRDLTSLASEGKLNKVHGGATALNQEFVRFEDKLTKHTDEKIRIAEYAARQIQDDDFVFIDAGTSTLLMTSYLKNSKATFVTNGVDHAKQLAKNGCNTIVLGDLLKNVLKYKPFMIKPNHHELGEIFSTEIKTLGDIKKYGKMLQDMGARNVLVSRGKDGAALLDENGNIHTMGNVPGKITSSVGCGDSRKRKSGLYCYRRRYCSSAR